MSNFNYRYYPAQINVVSYGKLVVVVKCTQGKRPVDNATVQVYPADNPDTVIYDLRTNSSGKTPVIDLPAPPIEYSMAPSENLPYSLYNVRVVSAGLRTTEIYGVQILPGVTAILPVITPICEQVLASVEVITIRPHKLVSNYPIRVYESMIKEEAEDSDKPVTIPETIIIHDGLPSLIAANFCEDFKDYIKNVTSGEIYATWSEESITTVILSIISSTLNRYYTQWYDRQGLNFTVTSSNAYDFRWDYGRNIYKNISLIVDNIFNQYISKPGIIQPLLTQTCIVDLTICPNMLSLWGTKSLGESGFTPNQILHFYFGETVFINSTLLIENMPYTWSGVDLVVGSMGEDVINMQNLLDIISRAYIAIPSIEANGIYNQYTAYAVSVFQEIFFLPITGHIDFATWYKISEVYASLNRRTDLC